ncbi:MAG TPA: carbamoyltransferase HypF [Acidimicrobiales bacterium]|nr:carbamoyltransferase HypF [Acidimicrobiales bacterium]
MGAERHQFAGGEERRRLRVTGTVQGVGFRPFVYRLAVELGLKGSVANDSRGVVIDVEAPAAALDLFAERLVAELPPLAEIETFEVERTGAEPTGVAAFSIVDSRAEGSPAVAVSVDVATCADCTRELLDPDDRRFGYPFVNCTNCGPRYTIILSIPYDRPSTTMAGFVLCAACRAEYTDPSDRRFHAEPVACPVCGPQLTLLSPEGEVVAKADDALDQTVALLAGGRVLAIKGLGGYHLSVDAGNGEAVAELRRRKARDDKPFAVMVGDLDEARRVAYVSAEAEAELASPRRPIVLVPRRDDSALAPRPLAASIAPRLPELGLMLPYTPLHTLLLRRFGGPLVMTSGNLSDEPIAHDDADALARLGPMVDAILTHDRPIHIRCDDSVVRARPAGKPVQMLRRSRGYAPAPIPLVLPTCHQVLAVGAELKNTVTVAKGTNLIASHHIGDLEHLAAYRSFLQAVRHLCDLTGVQPELVAHDLHPEYLSSKFAADLDLPALGVQHHHAHIASCLAEHRRDDRVLGVAFDGTGMGTDGIIWGGEFLVADLERYQRVGHLAAVALPGGVRAIREPWRMALAWARTALGREEAERSGRSVDERWPSILSIVEREDSLRTTSAGRLFDAVAALLGIRPTVTYEAQAAIELEAAATREPLDAPLADGWDVVVTAGDDGCAVLDPSPLVGRVVAERDRGTAVPAVAAAFHAGLGRGVASLAADLAATAGVGTVALSGGVFQNARLTEIVERELTAAGVDVLVHSRVPPNDGGVSVGQAAVAARWQG